MLRKSTTEIWVLPQSRTEMEGQKIKVQLIKESVTGQLSAATQQSLKFTVSIPRKMRQEIRALFFSKLW